MNLPLHASLLAERLFPLDGLTGSAAADAVVAAREYFGMDVAMLIAFHGNGTREVRHVAARDPYACPLEAGAVLPLEEGYCMALVTGDIPGVIPDTLAEPGVSDLPATRALRIGAYLGAPVYLPGGDLYGTLCCFSFQADPRLGEREHELLEALATRLGRQLASAEPA